MKQCSWCKAKDKQIGVRRRKGTWEAAPTSCKVGDFYLGVKCVQAKITTTDVNGGKYPLCQGCRKYIAGK